MRHNVPSQLPLALLFASCLLPSCGGDSNSPVNTAPILAPLGQQTVPVGIASTIQLVATDAEGDALIFSIDGSVGSGMDPTLAANPLTLDALNNTLCWSPAAADVGTYSLQVIASDQQSPPLTATETITLNVVLNAAPALVDPGDRDVRVGQPLSLTLSVTDPEGDTIALSADGTIGPGQDVFQAPNPATFNATTGLFAWQPNASQAGSYNVRFTATDDGTPPATSTQAIVISVLPNGAPSLDVVGDRVVTGGMNLTFALTGTDPEGDSLQWSADGTIGPDLDPFAQSPAATFSGSTRTFSWTPDASALGDYSVRLSVTDDGVPPLTDSETVTISVVDNQPPVLSG